MPDMPSIADLDELISLASSTGNCDSEFFFKTTLIGGTASGVVMSFMNGRRYSYWLFDGVPCGGVTGDIPAGGTTGTTGSIPTLSTTGSIQYTNAQSGNDKWLIQAGGPSAVGGTYILYDRLFHNCNLSGTSTSEQIVQGDPNPNPVITRYTDGVGNMVFIEVYTTIGSSLTTLVMSYTNQDGVTGCTSESIPIGNNGRRESPSVLVMPLRKGDTGVRAVKSVKLSATTGTVGNFGVTIGHPIAMFGANQPTMVGWRDYTTGLPGIPNIPDNSCLSLLFTSTASSIGEPFVNLTMVET